jgi:hypothetical protein
MTIQYASGDIFEAVLLSRTSDTLRAAMPGEDDVKTFTLINGAWISEECEPVRIEIAWERCEEARVPDEAECVCSQELASRLTSMLLVGTDAGDLVENMLYVNSAEGHRVWIHEGRLMHIAGEVEPEFSSAPRLPN